MSLPVLNQNPQYTMTIPSTGQRVHFRPYLVSEDKVLLLAYESKDKRNILNTMANTLLACIKEDIDITKLAMFDIEYMFTQVRAKSVGEASKLIVRCDNVVDGEPCGAKNDIVVNLDEIKVEVPKDNNVIQLTDTIQAVLQYPSFLDAIDMLEEENTDISRSFQMMGATIAEVRTDTELHKMKDESPEEVERFVNSLNEKQVSEIIKFIESTPALKHEVKYVCKTCQSHNTVTLEGLSDFF